MTLVDTSVWVDYLGHGNNELRSLLEAGEVLCHPFIVGELASGSMANRAEIIALLQSLPVAFVADHQEVMNFLDTHRLCGKGLGWIDLHLLASAILNLPQLWTMDRASNKAAQKHQT